MELTAEETAFLHRIAARWKRENLREERAMSLRIARRRETAWKVIDSLTAEFRRRDEHLMRVVLFGSLARDELLNDRFDIDLAVESSCCFDLLGITMDHDFPNADGLHRLKSELAADIDRLAPLEVKNKRAYDRIHAGADDDLDYAALGYTIHNIYSLIESYAARIAKVFENDIGSIHWHRDLIERMTLEIETVRPALWDRDTAALIDELRRFRHAFRNLYESDINPRRLMLIQDTVPEVLRRFRRAHLGFFTRIAALIEAMNHDSEST